MTAFRDSLWESLFETTNEAERLLDETDDSDKTRSSMG